MITALHNIDRSERELTKLLSLDEIKRRRHEAHLHNKEARKEAASPTSPLSVKVAEVRKPKEPISIDLELLEQFDTIHGNLERIAVASPLDALPMAKALFAALLRLSWARITGKANTNIDPETTPMKLFQKNVLSKTVMRRMKTAVSKPTNVSNLLECSTGLMRWLSGPIDCMVDINTDSPKS